MYPVGIMQGRLSPRPSGRAQAFPFATWQQEFDLAARSGFDVIEWLITSEGIESNPIFSPQGREEIRACVERSTIAVRTICADCFIQRRLSGVSSEALRDHLALFERLIVAAAAVDVRIITVPVLEEAALRSRQEARDFARAIAPAIAVAQAHAVTIAIESDADTIDAILNETRTPTVGACYDIGNAAAAGTDGRADLTRIGDALIEVHIKDRSLGGPSTGLGEGDADFDSLFEWLAAARFAGPLVLETPVGDDPFASATRHLDFVRSHAAATAALRQ